MAEHKCVLNWLKKCMYGDFRSVLYSGLFLWEGCFVKSWKRPPELNFMVLNFMAPCYILITHDARKLWTRHVVQILVSMKNDGAIQCQVLLPHLQRYLFSAVNERYWPRFLAMFLPSSLYGSLHHTWDSLRKETLCCSVRKFRGWKISWHLGFNPFRSDDELDALEL